MTTAYTTLLGLALPVTGELSGAWGDTVNNYITEYLDASVAGTQTLSGSQTAVTLSKTTNSALTQAGAGATGSSQYLIVNCTGNPASLLTITAPAASKPYIVINGTSTSQSVKIVGVGPTTGVTVISGEKAVVAWNGSDFVKVASSLGTGDVVGPASATDSAVPTFDGTTGKLIKNNAGVTIAAGVVTATGFSGPLNGSVGATTPTTVVATQVNVAAQGPVRFEDTAGGQYVGLRAPGTVAASYTLTLPTADGTSGQAVVTDGAGNLSFGTAGITTGKAIAMAIVFGF